MSRSANLPKRKLKMEQLDRRLLLAGDCAVALDSGGDLSVQCDNADNQVSISENFLTGELTVEGRFGTAINGVVGDTLNLGVVDLDDVDVRMGGGNDTLLINSIDADDVMLSLGSGDDTLIAGFVTADDDITIRGDQGNDNIGLLVVTAGDRINIRGGTGDDFVNLNLVEAQKLKLKGGNGTDTLGLGNVTGDVSASQFEL